MGKKAIYNSGPAGFVIGSGGVSEARLVKLSSGKVVHTDQDVTDDPIGATLGYGDENAHVSIDWINKTGPLRLEAAGAVSADADVFQEADGKVTVLPASSVDAWVGEDTYDVGDLVKPTTPNAHYYKCIEATGSKASSASESEPTWPTDGSTVEDTDLVWQDMGSSKFKRVGKALQAASGAGSIFGVLPYEVGDITNIAE